MKTPHKLIPPRIGFGTMLILRVAPAVFVNNFRPAFFPTLIRFIQKPFPFVVTNDRIIAIMQSYALHNGWYYYATFSNVISIPYTAWQ